MKNWFSLSWQEIYFLQKYSSETFYKKSSLQDQSNPASSHISVIAIVLSSLNRSHLGSLASPHTEKKNPVKAQFAQFVSSEFPAFLLFMAPTPCYYFPHSFYSLAYTPLIILKAKAALSTMLSLRADQVSLKTLTELSPAQKYCCYLAFPYFLMIITCSHPPESTELCQVEMHFAIDSYCGCNDGPRDAAAMYSGRRQKESHLNGHS